ncbi:hypothetical protein I3843_13G019500 [Carya illinoinensis]|uniref:RING-type E3 ubiquitin transferase n=1 Tax=Carya illinoinensis TaxID=32201 RepID=A0A922AEA1_CARIL|nr:hypothetical protein I3760_13G019900 [Carya illinoinensis]KAG6680063.1 hypothetical protein I3842_13G021000 [Carya illinoinensis]KAG7948680.1 hypothetical protein I3843_13G019500 [Carya illinoinensis]
MELMVKTANSMVTCITCCRNSIAIVLILCTILIIFCHNHHLISTFTFHHNPIPSNKDFLYCVVCLNEVMDGERFRKLPKCNHCFHVNCIDVWFQSHSTCPLCRNQICSVNPHQQIKHGFLHQFLSILNFFLGKT